MCPFSRVPSGPSSCSFCSGSFRTRPTWSSNDCIGHLATQQARTRHLRAMYSWTRKMGKRMPSEFGEQISLTWRNHANNESIIQPGPLALALLPRCLGPALKPGPWLAHGSWLMAHAAVSSSRTALNRGCDSTRAGDCQGMPMAPTKVCTQLMNGAPLPLLPACLSQIPRPCLGYPWLHFWSHPPPHCWLQIACLQPST